MSGNRPLSIPANEFALLRIFINHPMHTLTREHLLELLHGPFYDGSDRGIDVQVWRLRRIVETDPSSPRFIQTVRGRGYVFVPDGERMRRPTDSLFGRLALLVVGVLLLSHSGGYLLLRLERSQYEKRRRRRGRLPC